MRRCQRALESKLARETWKYSPLVKVTEALLNARDADWSPLLRAPEQVAVRRLSALPNPPSIPCNLDRYPLAGITAAKAEDCWSIEVQASLEEPLRLNPTPSGSATTVLLRVAPGCRVEIEERDLHEHRQHGGSGDAGGRRRQLMSARVAVLSLARDAQVRWSRMELEREASSWSLLQSQLADNATFSLHLHTAAAAFRRFDLNVLLYGQGARFATTGAALASAGAHLDQQVVVEHLGRNTHSRVKQHNLGMGAAGKDASPSSNGSLRATKARIAFNGRIHIHPSAVGADAELSNRNLALDADTEINTKPELEIYNDDVRCAHGATVGQLDEQALFYLQSRGLPTSAAKRLLCIGFLRDALAGPFAEQTADALAAQISLDGEA